MASSMPASSNSGRILSRRDQSRAALRSSLKQARRALVCAPAPPAPSERTAAVTSLLSQLKKLEQLYELEDTSVGSNCSVSPAPAQTTAPIRAPGGRMLQAQMPVLDLEDPELAPRDYAGPAG